MFMAGCRKCRLAMGVLVLALGVLFLLADLNVWNFWGIQWWSVVFLLAGLWKVCSQTCSDCQECSYDAKPKKKK